MERRKCIFRWKRLESLKNAKESNDVFSILWAPSYPLKGYLSEQIFDKINDSILKEMEQVLDYDRFMIGINGVVTFKKSTLPQILQTVPLERLVLETDSPYLAPVPYRGKRNETSYIIKVAEKLAEVHGVEVGEIKKETTRNALKVFKRVDKVFKVY